MNNLNGLRIECVHYAGRSLVFTPMFGVSPIQYIKNGYATQIACPGDILVSAMPAGFDFTKSKFTCELVRHDLTMQPLDDERTRLVAAFFKSNPVIREWITNRDLQTRLPPVGCGWDGLFTVASRCRHQRFTALFKDMPMGEIKALILNNAVFSKPAETPTNLNKATTWFKDEVFFPNTNAVLVFWDKDHQYITHVESPVVTKHAMSYVVGEDQRTYVNAPHGAHFSAIVTFRFIESGKVFVRWSLAKRMRANGLCYSDEQFEPPVKRHQLKEEVNAQQTFGSVPHADETFARTGGATDSSRC